MGSHTNYYHLILSLIRLKDELNRVKEPRLQPLIGLLRTKKIEFVEGCEEIPSNKELAAELGITVIKCNTWLKKLWEELKFSFFRNPLKIEQVIHDVIISRHWKEYHSQRQEIIDDENARSFSMEISLQVTPRIGEEIEIEFADRNGYYRGTVYEVIHQIIGKTQYIQIFTHPYENDYYRWMRLKQEYMAWGRKKYG